MKLGDTTTVEELLKYERERDCPASAGSKRLKLGNVYVDVEDGEHFIVADARDDGFGECLVVNFDGTNGYAASECGDYKWLAASLDDYLRRSEIAF